MLRVAGIASRMVVVQVPVASSIRRRSLLFVGRKELSRPKGSVGNIHRHGVVEGLIQMLGRLGTTLTQ
jgi:hypothetical protein